MAKVDLPSGNNILLGKMQRKDFLYNKFDKTSAENTELASLQTELANYGITASDWNTLQQQVTDGFNGVTTTVNNSVSTAITNHKAETDPHPQYALDSDLTSKAPLDSPVFTTAVTLPGNPQTALHAVPKQYADSLKPITGTYTGDGAASRDIALPFTPSAVYLNPKIDGTASGGGHAGLALNGFPLTTGGNVNYLVIGINKFTVSFINNSVVYSNESGKLYHYIAFP